MSTNGNELSSAVKNFFALDKEIKEAAKLIGGMRRKRKEAESSILEWMESNNKMRITTKSGQVLERVTRTTKLGASKQRVQEVAKQVIHDADALHAFEQLLFVEPPTREVIKLKAGKSQPPASATENL